MVPLSTAASSERGELGFGRKGFLRAVAGDGEGGIARRFDERRIERKPAGEIAGEAADEGVAGAGRVDGLDLERSDTLRALMSCEQRTAGAERHDDRLDALAHQAFRRRRDLVFRLDRHVGQNGELRTHWG